jgi:hypothetical protein
METRSSFITILTDAMENAESEEAKAHIRYILRRLQADFGYYEMFKNPQGEFRRDVLQLRRRGYVPKAVRVTRDYSWTTGGDETKRQQILSKR